MEVKLVEISEFLDSLSKTLAFVVEKDFLKQTTVSRLDKIVNDLLDKAEVCISKLDLCPDDENNQDNQDNNNDQDNTNVDPLVFLGFSLNLYGTTNDDNGHTEGLTFRVKVDGILYEVIGSNTKSPYSLHKEMATLLTNTTQPFYLDSFVNNGYITNYGYVLNAKSPTVNYIGKEVVVEVLKTENSPSTYGNITVQSSISTPDPNDVMQQVGVMPGVGYFKRAI